VHARKVFLVLLVLLTGVAILAFGTSSAQPPSKLTPDLAERIDAHGPQEKITVIIKLKPPEGPGQAKSNRASVKDDIAGKGGNVRREYTIFEGMAAEVPAGRIRGLANNPNVEIIADDKPVKAHLAESVPLINADDVWNKTIGGINITGEGHWNYLQGPWGL
jgi:hypothetical protein